jgi:hypothetical protein
MRSHKGGEDHGLKNAVQAGSGSSHPYSRSVIANYERLFDVSSDATKDIDFWTEGEIPIGFAEDGSLPKGTIVKLRTNACGQHVLLIGPTGFGKTNLLFILAEGLMKNGVYLWIFDPMRRHVNAYRRGDVIVFPIGNLRYNPNLEPPGVPYEDWLEVYTSVLAYSLILTDVSRGSLVQLIKYSNECFERKNEGLRSSIYEQRLAIQKLKPRSYRDYAKMAYWSRVEDRYDNMITSALGQIFACYRGHNLVNLLKKNIVFDCKGVSSFVLRVLIPQMVAWINCFKLYNDQGGSPLHGIFIEEGEYIYGIPN